MNKTATQTAAPAPVGEVLFINEESAAARYSVSVNFIRRLRYAGKLKAVAIGPRLVRYSVASLDAHFAAIARGGDGKAGDAPRGRCNAWRSRRNIRPKATAAKSTGTASGDTTTANA